ncbi:hypothetical protein EYR40_010536 [Pleurotus pulmonarius]|nr:hypothetical protein EYR36_010076 [Pleurotus pulmonarius]KAF4588980.1 hypothetical protein EYR40_010536 [Pleurotus pulmonarius]
MDKDEASEGGVFELLSWTTPAQFHFVVDRYNDFVGTSRNDGERAKFWKALEDDWMSAWDLTPEITQPEVNIPGCIRAYEVPFDKTVFELIVITVVGGQTVLQFRAPESLNSERDVEE